MTRRKEKTVVSTGRIAVEKDTLEKQKTEDSRRANWTMIEILDFKVRADELVIVNCKHANI